MPRQLARVLLVLVALLLAIFGPLVASGYTELEQAAGTASYREAAEHYRSAARRLPWRPDLYELAGHAYYHAKEYASADAVYRTASERGALSPAGWVAWGDVHYLSDDRQRAAEIWERALEQNEVDGHLYSRLAEIYQAHGEYAAAAEALQRYVSAYPEDAAARYRLGLLLTLPDPDRALTHLLRAAQLDPQFDPAAQTLRTTLNLAAVDDSASARLVIIGRGLGLVNEWPLARAAFEEAIRLDGKNADAHAWLAEADHQVGLPDGERAELDWALTLDPDSPTVRGLRGLHFQRIGNYREALTEFQAAAGLEPQNPMWYVSLGETHAMLGDLIRAMQAYQTATALAPEEPVYWRLLAIFCAENNVNIRDVGVPAAQRAVVLAEDDPASLSVLGWLLLLDARYEEAARMLERALELDPQEASAHLRLGMLYLQVGDRTSAYDHLVRARDLGNSEAESILNQYFP